MTNCKNCGAPIDIYAGRCPYCETPYEAPGGSETGENVKHESIIQGRHNCTLMNNVMTPNEYRTVMELDGLNKQKEKLRTELTELEGTIGSKWTDEDYIERAIKHARGELLVPK